jgi:hypothetical protein
MTLLLTLASAGASAQTATLAEGEVLRGHFVQERHLQGFAQPVRSEGSFVLVPGRGLIWRAEKPFPVVTVVTPAGLVQSVGGTETTRLPASRLPFLTRLYHMMGGAMAGDWRALEGEFTVAREPAGKATRITLTPRRADDPTATAIKSIAATVEHYVETVDIVRPGGDFDHLTFSAQVLSSGPPSAAESAALGSSAP